MTQLNEQQESELANIQSLLDDEHNIGTDTSQVVNLETSVGGEISIVDEKAKKTAEKKEKAEKAKAEKAKKTAEKKEKAEKAKAEKEQKAAEKKAEIEAKKTAKEAEAKEPCVEQNGIKFPSKNTSAEAIWNLITKLSTDKGSLVTVKEVMAVSNGGLKNEDGSITTPVTYITKADVEETINPANITAEMWAYKRFYGIKTVAATAA